VDHLLGAPVKVLNRKSPDKSDLRDMVVENSTTANTHPEGVRLAVQKTLPE
jgi:hypothetical protein